MCIVLNHYVYTNLLQQEWETNTYGYTDAIYFLQRFTNLEKGTSETYQELHT